MPSVKKWLEGPVDSTAVQVPRALAASAVVAVVDFTLLIFCVEQLGFHPAPAAVVGYLSGGVLQYILCSLWVFPNAPQNATSGFVAFTLLSLVGLVITWLAISVFHGWAHMPYPLAKIVALGMSFTWNFLSRKFLLFRPELAQNCS